MSNSFYTHGSFPSTGAAATSASMRNELDLITQGFDKLPTLASGSANQVVVLSATGLAMTTTNSLNGISIGSTTAAAGAFTTLSASGTVSGTGFSTYLASPPAIGGTAAAAITGTTITANTGFAGALNGTVGATTPASGAFTSLSASGTVSGTGFSTYLASPPAIGGTAAAAITGTTITATTAFAGALNGTVGATTPSTGAFTTLSASSTVSGTGFSTYLASPPAIGGTAAAAGSFTTLSASGTVSGTGFSTYLASPPAIGGTAAAAGSFTDLTYTGTLTGSTGILAIGTSQIYKDATGKVGIGTASPAVSLAISATDAILAPVGTTAQRPTGATGYIRYNTTLSQFEGYGASAWGAIGGGATGGGGEQVFWENETSIDTSYTITSNKNAGTFGPVTVATGVTVTVPTGSVWTIV